MHKATMTLLCAALATASVSTTAVAGVSDNALGQKVDLPSSIDWPRDFPEAPGADLTETTSNRITDLHAYISTCDFWFSTPGNYHMVLADVWHTLFLPYAQAQGITINNWFYTTSPPVGRDQIAHNRFTMGNLRAECTPNVVGGPKGYMNGLEAAGYLDGSRMGLFTNSGNVMVVKRGNPKQINNVWDLGRSDVRVTMSNPITEPGSYNNFVNKTLVGIAYNMALADGLESSEAEAMANELRSAVIGEGDITSKYIKKQWTRRPHGKHPIEDKFIASERIMHRNVFWSVAHGESDVTITFRHLALFTGGIDAEMEIIPLGGTVTDPEPLPGNNIGTIFVAKVANPNYAFSSEQNDIAEAFLHVMMSDDATPVFEQWGLHRPAGFVSTGALD